jgi:hypothetical protein
MKTLAIRDPKVNMGKTVGILKTLITRLLSPPGKSR